MPMKFYFRRIRFYYSDEDFYIKKWESVYNVDDIHKNDQEMENFWVKKHIV